MALHPQNYANLEIIQKSIMCVAFDDSCPADENEVSIMLSYLKDLIRYFLCRLLQGRRQIGITCPFVCPSVYPSDLYYDIIYFNLDVDG